jgi:hypothetical protein
MKLDLMEASHEDHRRVKWLRPCPDEGIGPSLKNRGYLQLNCGIWYKTNRVKVRNYIVHKDTVEGVMLLSSCLDERIEENQENLQEYLQPGRHSNPESQLWASFFGVS